MPPMTFIGGRASGPGPRLVGGYVRISRAQLRICSACCRSSGSTGVRASSTLENERLHSPRQLTPLMGGRSQSEMYHDSTCPPHHGHGSSRILSRCICLTSLQELSFDLPPYAALAEDLGDDVRLRILLSRAGARVGTRIVVVVFLDLAPAGHSLRLCVPPRSLDEFLGGKFLELLPPRAVPLLHFDAREGLHEQGSEIGI